MEQVTEQERSRGGPPIATVELRRAPGAHSGYELAVAAQERRFAQFRHGPTRGVTGGQGAGRYHL